MGLTVLCGVGLASGWFPDALPGPLAGVDGPGSASTTYLNLTIQASATSGLDQFTPANFTLPVNGRVVVTITNFDTGVNPAVPMWDQVLGAVSGTEAVAYGPSSNWTTVSSLGQFDLSHTFTIAPEGWMYNGSMMGNTSATTGGNASGGGMMGGGPGSMGGGPGMMGGAGEGYGILVNLPVPPAFNGSTPAIVTATFTLSGSGTYTWWCAAPCDPTSMATPGLMRGTITVG